MKKEEIEINGVKEMVEEIGATIEVHTDGNNEITQVKITDKKGHVVCNGSLKTAIDWSDKAYDRMLAATNS